MVAWRFDEYAGRPICAAVDEGSLATAEAKGRLAWHASASSCSAAAFDDHDPLTDASAAERASCARPRLRLFAVNHAALTAAGVRVPESSFSTAPAG